MHFDFDLAASDVTRQQCARSMQHASSACIQMYMYHRVTRRVTRKVGTMAMAVTDEVTEQYAAAMEETIASATNAEAARDAALARVAELEAKYEPPRPRLLPYRVDCRPWLQNQRSVA